MNQIADILGVPEDKLIDDIERLRKSQMILMSPQRQEEKIVKVYEILPEGIEEIDKTETEGFDYPAFGKVKSEVEILSLIDQVIKEVQDSQIEQPKKDSVTGKLSKVKDKLDI